MNTLSNQATPDQEYLNEYGDAVVDDDDDRITLQGKYVTPVGFYREVKALYKEVEFCLVRGVDYTAEDLCSEEYWGVLDSSMRRMAVLCLKQVTTLPYSILKSAPLRDCTLAYFQRT